MTSARFIADAFLDHVRFSRYMNCYNPPNNFCGLSLDKSDHVIENRTMVIRGYPPSDLISVV